MSLEELLEREPSVVSVGVSHLADNIERQGVPVRQVDWAPPVQGTANALTRLALDSRIAAANETALNHVLNTKPYLVDVVPSKSVVPILNNHTLLHAGPPITWEKASGPLRGALIGALLYEGEANDPRSAEDRLARGDFDLSPCHSHGVVGPMAGVVSPSMPMLVVEDSDGKARSFATLNEGLGRVLRYGAYSSEVIERLHWMDAVLGPILSRTVRECGPIDLHSLIAQALEMGDDGHNRNRAGTSLLLRTIGASLLESNYKSATQRSEVFRFIDQNDHFFLNVVMSAAKLGTDAATGVPCSSLVVAMARNGTEFGIQLSGTGSTWFTAPSPNVEGLFLGNYDSTDANPDIGDSAITETIGLGGFAMAAAPAIVGFVGGSARSAIERTERMYEITLTEHNLFKIPILESRGTPTGIDARLVVRTRILPQINTGIAGRKAGTGMVGAGLVEAPLNCFVKAINALADALS